MMAILLMITINVQAQDICWEPQITAGTYQLEINGTVIIFDMTDPDFDTSEAGWHCHTSVLPSLTGGQQHTFRIMAVDVSGWEGPWSDPFLAYRPGKSQNWKIRK